MGARGGGGALTQGFFAGAAGQNVRKLVKDGFVIKKPTIIHSRSRARASAEAKAKGRHTGYGGCCQQHNNKMCCASFNPSSRACLISW